MSVDYAGLQVSLNTFTTKVKAAIVNGEQLSVAQVNSLIDEMEAKFAAETLLQGEGSGAVVKSITEKAQTLEANVIDCAAANHFSKTITVATQLSVVNPAPTGRVTTFILHLTNPGAKVTWWAGVKWSGGVAPTLSVAGRDVLAFSTKDGGVTWDGYVIGQDMKAAA